MVFFPGMPESKNAGLTPENAYACMQINSFKSSFKLFFSFVGAANSPSGIPFIYVIGRATGSLSIYNVVDVPEIF